MAGRRDDIKICEVNDTRQMQKLSADPQFSCSKCGATARESSNLCQPVSYSGGSGMHH